ncbi:MAG: cell surface protein [Myxococcales bacterium]|nr:cell surface protein [Myxococcales bacterium]
MKIYDRISWIVFLVAALIGCGTDEVQSKPIEDTPACDLDLQHHWFAQEVVSFEPGPGAGFGEESYPDVVLGAPQGIGSGGGSLDVLSLGAGGEIVLGFGDLQIVDGDGPDFIVFENPFWPNGNPANVWADLGQVSVSNDGESWYTFPCDNTGNGEGQYIGCAGRQPVEYFVVDACFELDPETAGGDAFDLAELGLESARYVRIKDLATEGPPPSAGFDLDAVGVVYFE